MKEYYLTFECDCGETIKQRGAWISEGIPEIPFDVGSQTQFDCDECGNTYYTGELDYMEE